MIIKKVEFFGTVMVVCGFIGAVLAYLTIYTNPFGINVAGVLLLCGTILLSASAIAEAIAKKAESGEEDKKHHYL